MRIFQNRLEHRDEIARRGIDDLQYLGGRGLPFERLVPFGKCSVAFPLALVELPLQLGVGPAKFGHLVNERRGHVLAPSHPA